MSRNIALLALVISTVFSSNAAACSFAPGYRVFELSSTRVPESGRAPETPELSVQSIERGSDDGNPASCSDAGVLTLSFVDAEAPGDVGFLFELESGSFPDDVLPDHVVAPITLPDGSLGFYFVWLDLAVGQRSVEPIDVRISVRAVSSTMVEGPKVFVDIQHP